MTTGYDPRVGELLALEASGVRLPYPAQEIVRLEDDGYIVDIDSGELWQNVTIEATPVLEALVIVDKLEVAS